MPAYSGILAWEIPWTEEPAGLQSTGSQESDIEFPRETGLILRCAGKAGNPFQTTQGIFVWRIPWTEEPGRLQSIGWQRVRHDWSDLARAHIARRGA